MSAKAQGFLETILAKMLVLALLHLFTNGIELMTRHDVSELWKQHSVLSRRVRPVHVRERAQRPRQLGRIAAAGGEREHPGRDRAADLVLLAQHRDQRGQLVGLLEAREQHRAWRYAVFMGAGATAGAFIGGGTARTAGVLGGTLIGFIVANNSGNGKEDVTLKRGEMLHLKFGEDLVLR